MITLMIRSHNTWLFNTKWRSEPPSNFEERISMAREYEVIVPIAGHACITVIANSEDEAIERALGEVDIDNIESWEALRDITRGNVCYAPTWSASAEAFGDEIEDEAAQ